MNITYRREIKRNFMMIEPEDLEWEGYEIHMVEDNLIEGLLPFKLRQTENGFLFYYDITSKQPLSRMLETQKWRSEQIVKLLVGISGILERMEQYLLQESRILMEPEYIYIDPDSFRIWLCLVPGLTRDFPEDFGRLLGKILEYVDHQDKESVVLAYGIYQETRKENYGIDDIMRLVRAHSGKHTAQIKESEPVRVENSIPEEEPFKSTGMTMQRVHLGPKEEERDIRNTEEKLIEKIIRFFRRLTGGKLFKKEEPEQMVRVPWEMMFREEEKPTEPDSPVTGRTDRFREDIPVQRLEEPERRSEVSGTRPELSAQNQEPGTVLLADLSMSDHNRVLRAMDYGMEDIRISYYPFVIGKQENLVDYKLDRDTVSRLHLRIDCEDGRYFIQDLNSSNGTSLRGKLLENNEAAEIFVRDEISIAQYRYSFE